MIRRTRVAAVLATGCSLVAVTLFSLSCATVTPPAPHSAPIPAVSSTQSVQTPILHPAFTAMTYYDDNCARCHGPQGSFYGPTLGKKLTDAQLIKVVNDMAEGPGNAPLKVPELAVETAIHRAFIQRTPYLSLTAVAAGKWSGEVMTDAKVTLSVGGKTYAASVDGWNWTAQLPPQTQPADVQIIADLDGRTTTLKPIEACFSHGAPLLPPDKR